MFFISILFIIHVLSGHFLFVVDVVSFSFLLFILININFLQIPPNGIKYAMTISEWPFKAYTSKLQVAIRADAQAPSGSECKTTNLSTDDSGNVRWVQIELNGVILYPKKRGGVGGGG